MFRLNSEYPCSDLYLASCPCSRSRLFINLNSRDPLNFLRFEPELALVPRSIRQAQASADVEANSPDYFILVADADRFGSDLS